MAKTLDGALIRIKGTTVITNVRYCTDANGHMEVVTDMYPGVEDFVTDDNPYGDCFGLDKIELRRPNGDWYTPTFKY
jgi:hypothetical protein